MLDYYESNNTEYKLKSDDNIKTTIETNEIGISTLITYHNGPDAHQLRRHADALRSRLDEILSFIEFVEGEEE